MESYGPSLHHDREAGRGGKARGEDGEIEEGPPPLTESEWSETEDDDTETSVNEEVDSCGKNS